jgi:competence protein ComEA
MRLMISVLALLLGCGTVSLACANPAVHPQTVVAQKVAQVNLNTATTKELKTVPGLNASRARAIVAYRKKNGPFTALEDLQKITGFKRLTPQKWQEIKQNFILG